MRFSSTQEVNIANQITSLATNTPPSRRVIQRRNTVTDARNNTNGPRVGIPQSNAGQRAKNNAGSQLTIARPTPVANEIQPRQVRFHSTEELNSTNQTTQTATNEQNPYPRRVIQRRNTVTDAPRNNNNDPQTGDALQRSNVRQRGQSKREYTPLNYRRLTCIVCGEIIIPTDGTLPKLRGIVCVNCCLSGRS